MVLSSHSLHYHNIIHRLPIKAPDARTMTFAAKNLLDPWGKGYIEWDTTPHKDNISINFERPYYIDFVSASVGYVLKSLVYVSVSVVYVLNCILGLNSGGGPGAVESLGSGDCFYTLSHIPSVCIYIPSMCIYTCTFSSESTD